MSQHVDVNKSVWNEQWMADFTPIQKALYWYFYTNVSIGKIGMYKITLRQIQFDMNGIDMDDLVMNIKALSPKVEFDFTDGVVWVVDFWRDQYLKTGKIADKQLKGSITELERFRYGSFYDAFIVHECYAQFVNPLHTHCIPIAKGTGEERRGEVLNLNKLLDKTKEGFNSIWDKYRKGRKDGRDKAFKAFCKLSPTPELTKEILDSLDVFCHTDNWKREKGKYFPMLTTFLNQRRWEDMPESKTATGYNAAAGVEL